MDSWIEDGGSSLAALRAERQRFLAQLGTQRVTASRASLSGARSSTSRGGSMEGNTGAGGAASEGAECLASAEEGVAVHAPPQRRLKVELVTTSAPPSREDSPDGSGTGEKGGSSGQVLEVKSPGTRVSCHTQEGEEKKSACDEEALRAVGGRGTLTQRRSATLTTTRPTICDTYVHACSPQEGRTSGKTSPHPASPRLNLPELKSMNVGGVGEGTWISDNFSGPSSAPDLAACIAELLQQHSLEDTQVSEAQIDAVLSKAYGEELLEGGEAGDRSAELEAAREYLCSVITMLTGDPPSLATPAAPSPHQASIADAKGQTCTGGEATVSPVSVEREGMEEESLVSPAVEETPNALSPAAPVTCRSPEPGGITAASARMSLLSAAAAERQSSQVGTAGSAGGSPVVGEGGEEGAQAVACSADDGNKGRGDDDEVARAQRAAEEVRVAIRGLQEVRASLGQVMPTIEVSGNAEKEHLPGKENRPVIAAQSRAVQTSASMEQWGPIVQRTPPWLTYPAAAAPNEYGYEEEERPPEPRRLPIKLHRRVFEAKTTPSNSLHPFVPRQHQQQQHQEKDPAAPGCVPQTVWQVGRSWDSEASHPIVASRGHELTFAEIPVSVPPGMGPTDHPGRRSDMGQPNANPYSDVAEAAQVALHADRAGPERPRARGVDWGEDGSAQGVGGSGSGLERRSRDVSDRLKSVKNSFWDLAAHVLQPGAPFAQQPAERQASHPQHFGGGSAEQPKQANPALYASDGRHARELQPPAGDRGNGAVAGPPLRQSTLPPEIVDSVKRAYGQLHPERCLVPPKAVPLPDENLHAIARSSALRAVGGEFDYTAAISGLEDLHHVAESLEKDAKMEQYRRKHALNMTVFSSAGVQLSDDVTFEDGEALQKATQQEVEARIAAAYQKPTSKKSTRERYSIQPTNIVNSSARHRTPSRVSPTPRERTVPASARRSVGVPRERSRSPPGRTAAVPRRPPVICPQNGNTMSPPKSRRAAVSVAFGSRVKTPLPASGSSPPPRKAVRKPAGFVPRVASLGSSKTAASRSPSPGRHLPTHVSHEGAGGSSVWRTAAQRAVNELSARRKEFVREMQSGEPKRGGVPSKREVRHRVPRTGSDPAVKRESSGNPPAFEDRSGPLYNMLRALAAALLQQHSDDVETTSTAAETHVDQNAAVRQDIINGDNANSNDIDNVAKRHDREFTQVHDIRRAARTVQDGGQLPSDGDNGAASSRAQHVADSTHDESGVSSSSEEWRTGPQEPSKAQAKANDLDDKDEHQSDNSMASSVEDWVASRVVAEMLIEKLSRERGQPTSAGGVSKNMDGARREGVNLDIAELVVYDAVAEAVGDVLQGSDSTDSQGHGNSTMFPASAGQLVPGGFGSEKRVDDSGVASAESSLHGALLNLVLRAMADDGYQTGGEAQVPDEEDGRSKEQAAATTEEQVPPTFDDAGASESFAQEANNEMSDESRVVEVRPAKSRRGSSLASSVSDENEVRSAKSEEARSVKSEGGTVSVKSEKSVSSSQNYTSISSNAAEEGDVTIAVAPPPKPAAPLSGQQLAATPQPIPATTPTGLLPAPLLLSDPPGPYSRGPQESLDYVLSDDDDGIASDQRRPSGPDSPPTPTTPDDVSASLLNLAKAGPFPMLALLSHQRDGDAAPQPKTPTLERATPTPVDLLPPPPVTAVNRPPTLPESGNLRLWRPEDRTAAGAGSLGGPLPLLSTDLDSSGEDGYASSEISDSRESSQDSFLAAEKSTDRRSAARVGHFAAHRRQLMQEAGVHDSLLVSDASERSDESDLGSSSLRHGKHSISSLSSDSSAVSGMLGRMPAVHARPVRYSATSEISSGGRSAMAFAEELHHTSGGETGTSDMRGSRSVMSLTSSTATEGEQEPY